MEIKETFFTGVVFKLLLALILFVLSIYAFKMCSGPPDQLICTQGLIIPAETVGEASFTDFISDYTAISVIDILFWYIIASLILTRVGRRPY